jgi:RNA polymerase sigma-70 factor, ECF subfamily
MALVDRTDDATALAPPDPEAEEITLVTAVVSGDRDALARLYDRHAGRLAALIARILGDGTQAEDVVHDVFVEAWHHAHEFDPRRGTVRSWLTTRARSRALDRVGHRERGVRAHAHAYADGLVATAGARDVEGQHDAAILRGSLAGLPPELADVIEGAYYQGMSATELADRFSIPVGTVKSRLARAIAHLRERLLPVPGAAIGGDA